MRLQLVVGTLVLALAAACGASSNHDGGAGGGAATGGGGPTGGGSATGGGGGSADAGPDAGATDAGPTDAGGDGGLPPDDGGTDAGSGDGGPATPDGGTCGDGVVNAGEQCDDFNVVGGDGCSAACTVDPGHFFELEPNDDGTVEVSVNDFSTADANGPFAANADGGLVIHGSIDPEGDEDVFAFTNSGAAPVNLSFEVFSRELGLDVSCGDATIDTALFVRSAVGTRLANNDDRGITPFADFCSTTTYLVPPMTTVYLHLQAFDDASLQQGYLLRVRSPSCGNGVTEPGEECDDANPADGDGCSASCRVEAAFTCAGTPSTCARHEAACGDGADNDGDGQRDCADSDCAAGCVMTGLDGGTTPSFPPCPAGQQLFVFNSIDYHRPIPDDAPSLGLSLPITPSITGTAITVGVRVNALHTYDDDLDLSLSVAGVTAPVDLSSDNGGNGDDYLDTVFADACSPRINSGQPTAPFNGCFAPEGNLSTLGNRPAASTWTFSVADDTFDDYGTLLNWSLLMCVAP